MMKKENISKFVGEHKWKIVGGVVTVAAFVSGVGAGYGYCCSEGKEHYYRGGHEYQLLKKTDTEMGKISNLITDMTLAGADDNKMARAVRHSMVVIDAGQG